MRRHEIGVHRKGYIERTPKAVKLTILLAWVCYLVAVMGVVLGKVYSGGALALLGLFFHWPVRALSCWWTMG